MVHPYAYTPFFLSCKMLEASHRRLPWLVKIFILILITLLVLQF